MWLEQSQTTHRKLVYNDNFIIFNKLFPLSHTPVNVKDLLLKKILQVVVFKISSRVQVALTTLLFLFIKTEITSENNKEVA